MVQPVFLEYDREALDREYDNRKKVADAAAWLTRFAKESAAARAEIPCRLDVPYGTHPSERLDIFPAEPATPAPVHVFIHGGYWHRLDKKDFSYVARAFAPAGVATVVINYARMPRRSAVIRSASPSRDTRPAATSSQCCSRRTGRRSRAYPPTS